MACLAAANDEAGEAVLLQNARENLPKLRQEVLQTLDQSRQNDPKIFQSVVQENAAKISSFLNADLQPIDMSRVDGAPYATFNTDIWQYREVSQKLNGLALAYAIPESPLAGKPELVAKAVQGFEWLLSITSPEGTCRAPDTNIDRFAYVAYWDAFVLLAPNLPQDLRERFLKMMLATADYQLKTFGVRSFPWGKGYPNMDAAYMLVMEEAFRLYGSPVYTADLDLRLKLLQDRQVGATWEYLAGWNPQATYTLVTLEFVGRLYQLSGNPVALKQLQAHADYYKYHIEPNGLLDYGMTPFIKHDWSLQPFAMAAPVLDLVNCYNPTPVLQDEVDRVREAAVQNASLFGDPRMLYWISRDSGQREAAPSSFIRTAPEIAGFQGRKTNTSGTLTVYGTGKEIASDTRISAFVSDVAGKESAILLGSFLELIQNGASYYLGDMHPTVDLQVSDTSAVLNVTQKRHMMGPLSKPLVMGDHHADMKNWTFDCWKGGSPDGPPIETDEKWIWNGDSLAGTVTLTALEETKLDGVEFSLPIALAPVVESKLLPGGGAARYGKLCVVVQGDSDRWTCLHQDPPFDFRADVPSGDYVVTLSSGDADFPTDPFDVLANGEKVAASVTAPAGRLTERSFPVTVSDGAILLKFVPQHEGSHWKVVSLSIASANQTFHEAFALGHDGEPAAAGITRITGADVYTPERGYGWSRNLSAQERHHTGAGGPNDLITTPSLPTMLSLRLDTPEKWEKGKSTSLRIVVGMGTALDSWMQAVDAAPSSTP